MPTPCSCARARRVGSRDVCRAGRSNRTRALLVAAHLRINHHTDHDVDQTRKRISKERGHIEFCRPARVHMLLQLIRS